MTHQTVVVARSRRPRIPLHIRFGCLFYSTDHRQPYSTDHRQPYSTDHGLTCLKSSLAVNSLRGINIFAMRLKYTSYLTVQ